MYVEARVGGPLATFDADAVWVEHPNKNGVVLVGDATATCDPTFGQGLALTLRSVRVLRDQLHSHGDWDTAGHAYAETHDCHYSVIDTVEDRCRSLLLETEPEAEARRTTALPLIAQDGTRMPDLFSLGPEVPIRERVRRRAGVFSRPAVDRVRFFIGTRILSLLHLRASSTHDLLHQPRESYQQPYRAGPQRARCELFLLQLSHAWQSGVQLENPVEKMRSRKHVTCTTYLARLSS